ncbi:hypothetical protein MCM1_1552 [Methanosarcina barkeri CM1]|uniref:Uncharacterized protein n=1 Tax=Methanosarcina barkeri CM1 TaxID=796385 RepID=A0A0G3CHJ9_METBA|nr:hypothetical protein MCM1_1552 [Methanosarcina barkeri CM1]
MKLLGKSKIMKHRVKPEITYPLIRLPQSEVNLAGEVAHIFKTEYNGKPVYVISLDEEFNAELKVTQQETNSNLELRIEALEKKLNKHLESENKDNKRNGPAEIRTQDPRRVKAMS